MIVPHELPHQLFQLLFPTGQTVINLRAFISASHTLTEKKLGHAVYICFEHGTVKIPVKYLYHRQSFCPSFDHK